MTKLLVLIGALLILCPGAFASTKLKKISVTDSNNGPYFLYSGEGVFAKRDLAYLTELKHYVESHGFPVVEKNGELDFIISSLKWVSSQWDHDGMNEPAKGAKGLDVLKDVYDKKTSYRCVEYGLVLSDVLQAYGFITRTIGMRSVDVAYGKPGSGHVATEVWVNSLDKWIFVDPQFGLYLTAKGGATPLNYFEIAVEKKFGRWEALELHFLKPSATVAQDTKGYKEFLSRYFGFMTVSDGAVGTPRISLYLESKNPALTFQGLQQDDIIFSDDVKMVYPEMNRVGIMLKYKAAPNDFKALFDKLKINGDEDYLNKMGAFAAKPDFTATFKTTEPFFDHYEYKTDSSKWSALNKDSVDWSVKKSSGRLEVRAVNKLGRPGPVTYLALSYE